VLRAQRAAGARLVFQTQARSEPAEPCPRSNLLRPACASPALTAQGMPPTGLENYGGPIVTAGGLVFIAAAKDEMLRGCDRRNGKLLWQAKLPAGGYAGQATYVVKGRQYVVIACGGGKMGTKSGDAYVAFALKGN
jgi:hypothetical protein